MFNIIIYLVLLIIFSVVYYKIYKRITYISGDSGAFINMANQYEKRKFNCSTCIWPYYNSTSYTVSAEGYNKTPLYKNYIKLILFIKKLFNTNYMESGKIISAVSIFIVIFSLLFIYIQTSLFFDKSWIFQSAFLLTLIFPGILIISSLVLSDLPEFALVYLTAFCIFNIGVVSNAIIYPIFFFIGMLSVIIITIRYASIVYFSSLLIFILIGAKYYGIEKEFIYCLISGIVFSVLISLKHLKSIFGDIINCYILNRKLENFFENVEQYKPVILVKNKFLNFFIKSIKGVILCFSWKSKNSIFGLIGFMGVLSLLGMIETINHADQLPLSVCRGLIFLIIFFTLQLLHLLPTNILFNQSYFNSRYTIILVPIFFLFSAIFVEISNMQSIKYLYLILVVIYLFKYSLKIKNIIYSRVMLDNFTHHDTIEPSSLIKFEKMNNIFAPGAKFFSDNGKNMSCRRKDDYFITSKHFYIITKQSLEKLILYYKIQYLIIHENDYTFSKLDKTHDADDILTRLYFKLPVLLNKIRFELVKETSNVDGKFLIYRIIA